MLSIRLARVGRVNWPAYRVVVQEKTRAPRSKVIEILGQYDPKLEPAKFEVKKERLDYWMSVGARPTVSAAELLVKQDLLKLEQVPELQHERDIREASKKRATAKKAHKAQVEKDKKKRAEAKAKASAKPAKPTEDKPTAEKTSDKKEEVKSDSKPVAEAKKEPKKA